MRCEPCGKLQKASNLQNNIKPKPTSMKHQQKHPHSRQPTPPRIDGRNPHEEPHSDSTSINDEENTTSDTDSRLSATTEFVNEDPHSDGRERNTPTNEQSISNTNSEFPDLESSAEHTSPASTVPSTVTHDYESTGGNKQAPAEWPDTPPHIVSPEDFKLKDLRIIRRIHVLSKKRPTYQLIIVEAWPTILKQAGHVKYNADTAKYWNPLNEQFRSSKKELLVG